MRYAAILFAAFIVALAAGTPLHAQNVVKPRTDSTAPGYAWPAVDYDRDGVYDRVDHCTNSPAGCVVDHYGCSIDADGDGVCDGLDRCANTSYGVKVDRHGCVLPTHAGRGTYAVPASYAPAPEELQKNLFKHGYLSIDGRLLFNTASHRIRPGAYGVLREFGELMRAYPRLRFEIAGHADSRGPQEYNLALSQNRAEAVRRFMLEKAGVNVNQLVARGYGETQIVTPERSDGELQANRRVEFRLVNPESLPRGVKIVRPVGPIYAGYYR